MIIVNNLDHLYAVRLFALTRSNLLKQLPDGREFGNKDFIKGIIFGCKKSRDCRKRRC
jgi:hypothetical protein